MKPTEQKTMLDFLNEVSVEEGGTSWHMIYNTQDDVGCNFIPQEAGRSYAQWAISQMQPEWISVEDRLPEIGEFVLVYRIEGYYSVDQYRQLHGEVKSFMYNVTHWMPLPNPPFTQCEMYGHSLQPVVGFDNEITDYQCIGCGILESSIPQPPTK